MFGPEYACSLIIVLFNVCDVSFNVFFFLFFFDLLETLKYQWSLYKQYKHYLICLSSD